MVGSSSTSAIRRDMTAIMQNLATFARHFVPTAPAPAPRPRAKWHCAHLQRADKGDEDMQRNAAGHRLQDAVGDFAELIAKAFFGGLGAAIVMSLAILLLSANAQAATLNDAKAGTLMLGNAQDGYTPA